MVSFRSRRQVLVGGQLKEDRAKTKQVLIRELRSLREQVAEREVLEKSR